MNKIPRREFLKVSGAMGAGLAAWPLMSRAGEAGNKPASPNVLFITCDDLRPQLGCYGRAEMKTPHIDKFAASAMCFERAYCPFPSCGPSRASIFSGIYPPNVGGNEWRSDSTGLVTLQKWFKQHGYYAVSNGKVLHYEADGASFWSEKPWREVLYQTGDDWAGYNTFGLWQNPTSGQFIDPQTRRGPFCESADVDDSAYPSGRVADKTITDLKRLKEKNQPFFLACGFYKSHLPFNAPKKYWDLYQPEEIALANNRFLPKNLPKQCHDGFNEINQYARAQGREYTDDFHREARHAYYACVSYIDAQVGRVLQALDDLGLAENTIVLFCADHGWNLGEHTFWGKHNLLENCLRVPCILRAPGVSRPGSSHALVEGVDIYPTLCELAGLPAPDHQQGISCVPLLHKPDRLWKEATYSVYRNGTSVKTDRYRFTEWRKDGKVIARMLFDHQQDPEENENIAEKPEHAELVARLSKMMDNEWRSTHASKERARMKSA